MEHICRKKSAPTVNSAHFGRAETKRFVREWHDFLILTRKLSAPIVKYDVFEHRWCSVDTEWPLLGKICVSSRRGPGGTQKMSRIDVFSEKMPAVTASPPAGSGQGLAQGCDDG